MRMLAKADIRRRLQPLAPLPTGLTPRGALRPPVRSVMFDVYGTLFISASGDIDAAQNRTSGRAGLEILLRKYHIARSATEIFQELYAAVEAAHAASKKSGVRHPEVDIVRIWQAITGLDSRNRVKDFAVEFEITANPVYPMPHLPEVLKYLVEKNVAMGIISNAQFYTPMLFDWFFDAEPEDLGFRPDLLFFSYRFGRAKPSPVLFESAARALSQTGVTRQEILYIGNDMLNDVYPAHASGFQTALFAGDRRSLRLREDEDRCRGLKPDVVITDLIQLIDLV